jgi:excisionase family DNA binding protein
MVVAALEVWASTRVGVPPGQVRDRMVKAAFDAAYRSGNAAPSEYVSDEIEMFLRSDMGVLEPSLKATSILDVEKIRDPDVVEQIKGERFGALLQRVGCYDAVKEFHEDLRVGRRSGSVSQTVKSSLARFRISDPNLYHYMSDLYPPFVGIKEAADVMGVTLSAAHRLVRAGEFPFPVARAGNRYKVSVKALMHFMEIPDAAVHVDDVENGALHVRETRGDVRQGV